MASYWENDNKIQIKQTQVSVPSVNGLEYSGGQRVDIEIPSTIKFIDPQNSYINFDVKLKLPAGEVPTRLQLDDLTGGQSLFRNVRIYSNIGARVLLEEYQDYNVKVAMEYSYNQDDSIRNMRALREGATAHNLLTSGTHGTTTSQLQDTTTNPYFIRHQGTLDTDFSDDDFLTVKCCLNLKTGLFSGNKLIPNNLLGCYIEIDLESPQKVMKQLDSVNRWRRVDLCPTFWGTDLAGNTGIVYSDVANITDIYLGKDNGVVSLETCPFVVGEYINFCDRADVNDNTTPSWNVDGNNWADAKPVKITAITMDGGYVKLTVEAFRLTAALSREIPNGEVGAGTHKWIVYSATIDRLLTNKADTTQTHQITSYTPSYTVSNLELICAQVELDPQYEMGMMMKMREGGAIEMDFISCTNNKHNLLSSNRNATVDLNMNYSRAKSVIIVPTDATPYNTVEYINSLGATYKVEEHAPDNENWNIYPQRGILDNLTQYQFLIMDSLSPSRPIKVSKFRLGRSIAAQPLVETEKALNQAMIPCRSFVDYCRNFVIGKCFGLNDGVMNLQGQNVQLQLLYNEHDVAGTDKPPLRNKMLNCLAFHIRKIVIRQDSVSVIL